MPESFFELSQKDRREALEYARDQTGRPAHLLEKDIWVVWALRTLFEAQVGADLTFKGGTSLSKVYKVIDRFSEDIQSRHQVASRPATRDRPWQTVIFLHTLDGESGFIKQPNLRRRPLRR